MGRQTGRRVEEVVAAAAVVYAAGHGRGVRWAARRRAWLACPAQRARNGRQPAGGAPAAEMFLSAGGPVVRVRTPAAGSHRGTQPKKTHATPHPAVCARAQP